MEWWGDTGLRPEKIRKHVESFPAAWEMRGDGRDVRTKVEADRKLSVWRREIGREKIEDLEFASQTQTSSHRQLE
jgi:hypothetical protein